MKKNSRCFRLTIGITILFSLLIFQGSKHEGCSGDGCLDEALEDLGEIQIHNHTPFVVRVSLVRMYTEEREEISAAKYDVNTELIDYLEKGRWLCTYTPLDHITKEPIKVFLLGFVSIEPGKPAVVHIRAYQ